MREPRCPFCGHDPYEYVDIGVGYERVAVTCCSLGVMLFDWRTSKAGKKIVNQILEFRQSHSPRKKARAKRLMELHGDF